MSEKFRTYTDGGARGNPGPAGIGIVIQRLDERSGEYRTIHTIKEYIGESTNNQAEYRALLRALLEIQKIGAPEVECMLDSELVVKQLNREYRVKDQKLAPIFLKIWDLTQGIGQVSFRHIPRDQNKEADRLVNQAIDEHIKGKI